MDYYKITDTDKKKKLVILLLYLGSACIMFLGVFFIAYSYLNKIEFQVLGTQISGMIFGLLVTYLGAKYYFMVSDFKEVLYQSKEQFSWSNFRKKKQIQKKTGSYRRKLL